MKENTAAVHIHLPVETATFLLNEKRMEISAIESRVGTPVMILPTSELETPHYHIRRLKIDEYEKEADVPSYEIEIVEAEEEEELSPPGAPTPEKPVIGPFSHAVAALTPALKKTPKGGFLKRILGGLFTKETSAKADAKSASAPQTARPQQRHQRDHGRGGPRRDHGHHRGPRPERAEQRPHTLKPEAASGAPPTPTPQGGGAVGQEANGQRHEGSRRRRRRGGRGGQNRMGGAPGGQQRNDRPQSPEGPASEHQYPDGNRAVPMPGFRSPHESVPVAPVSVERTPESNTPVMTREERPPAPPVARDESQTASVPATQPSNDRVVMVETRNEPPASGDTKPN